MSAEDARTVASIFTGEYQTKAGAARTIGDVIEIKSADGQVTMYAVNFTNDNGYVIISASKKYYPILAFSEKGCITRLFLSEALNVWVEEANTSIEFFKKRDNVKPYDFSEFWKKYELFNMREFPTTKSEDEFMSLRMSSVANWANQGYTCYSLDDPPADLPASVYDSWCTIAQSQAYEWCDYMLYSVILEQRIDSNPGTGPLMASTWSNQDDSYNAAVPYYDSDGQHISVGCVPVAIGQIMRYFQRPSNITWSNMPLNCASSTTASFLYLLGRRAGIDYSSGNSGTTDYNALNVLSSYYNYSGTLISHNVNALPIIKQNILNGKPVYMGGGNHAWVCEGYKEYSYSKKYILQVISVYPPWHYEFAAETVVPGTLNLEYYYMNWGGGGNHDGWFFDNSLPFPGLQSSRQDIVNITPPSN